MNKLIRFIVIFLMFRIDWRKLLFAGTIISIVVVAVQIYTLPYPLTIWVLAPPMELSSNRHVNSTLRLRETPPVARLKPIPVARLKPIPVARLKPVPIAPPSIKLNSSAEVSKKDGAKVVSPRRNSRRRRRHVKQKVMPPPPAPPPPPLRMLPDNVLRYVWSLKPEQALVYAKKEIENATYLEDDPDLYAPLFRNVSSFRRSYELMELILKVYIYPDGESPIFHEPHLQGIYSSEGWFMKLMEGNRQYVTTDPEKAHLFYLPYSARQLQMALYVPNSHNIKPLSIFLRNHVNMLAEKYPFWNRTHGSDHFLVACHDWGPYTVTAHEELAKNTIKALCNADVSEGVFIAGKDVSLPETTIRNPSKPQRDLGGKRVSQRPLLAFFAGNMHGRVRPTLLKHWGDKDDDMRIYGPLPNRVSRIMSYVQHMKSSKYCLCPMGYEVNSPRIVEAIYYECVPVIIADNFIPPLNDVLQWSNFSVIVAEKEIPNLKDILEAIPLRRYLVMQTNVKMLRKHFHWNPIPIRYDMFHMILHSIWFNRLSQFQIPQSSGEI